MFTKQKLFTLSFKSTVYIYITLLKAKLLAKFIVISIAHKKI